MAGSPRTVTDRLQRVLNAAARIVSGIRKFDRGLTHLLHSELHLLDVPERIQHKLGVTVHRCLQGKAPKYLIVTVAASSAVGGSLSLVRWSGTHCLITSGTQRSALTVLSHA